MKNIYEAPEAEIIDLKALEEIALIEDRGVTRNDNVDGGSQNFDDTWFN